MKSILLSMLVFTVFRVNAQQVGIQNPADEMVTITTPLANVANWFELIARKGIVLSYNPSVIDLGQIRKVDAGEITVGKLLQTVLSDYTLKIIFAEPRKLILQAEKKKRYTISGRIKEAGSSENLYGASIIFHGENNRKTLAVSGSNGMYSLILAEGNYRVEASYIGYKGTEKKISVNRGLALNFELTPCPFEMEDVVIESRTFPTFPEEINPADLLSFSSSDLFAQIRILPGVMASSANGDFQVNGGTSDENLMLLDGISVYHPNHLNTMLPSFNGDAIKSVGFHKSMFPTRFEGRLSSVTDIRLKDGNKTRHSQTFSMDMPAASLMCEGPILKNKLSYMVSARRSWLDFFDNLLADKDRLDHSFFDFNLKLSYDFNAKTTLQLIAYKALNNYFLPSLEPNKPVMTWNNALYACKLHTVFGKKLINTTSLSYTSYSNRATIFTFSVDDIDPAAGEATDFNDRIAMGDFADLLKPTAQPTAKNPVVSGINEISLSTEFSYNANNIYHAAWGINSSFEQLNISGLAGGHDNRSQPIAQLSIFYDNRIRITDKLVGQAGVHFVAYLPDNFDDYYSIQPRLSLKYTLNDRNLLYAGFSRMAQFYHYMRMDMFSFPTDFRMPSIAGYKPRTSNQVDVGWKHFLPAGLIESSLFYKSRGNIIALKPEAFPQDEAWKDLLMVGNGKSYGFRFFMYNKWRKFAVQLSYAYSRSFERFPYLEERDQIPALTDIPHVLNTAVTYNLTNRSAFSMGGVLKSGKITGNADDMITLPEEDFRNLRSPFNYRLDASYSYAKQFKKNGAKLLLRVGLYNIFGNPAPEDMMDFYTANFQEHCLPYGSITVKF